MTLPKLPLLEMSSGNPAHRAAAALVTAGVLAAVLLAAGRQRGRVGLEIQSLRPGGMDGSGDTSVFAPAGWGMDPEPNGLTVGVAGRRSHANCGLRNGPR